MTAESATVGVEQGEEQGEEQGQGEEQDVLALKVNWLWRK
jgi:hypothetical protein